MFNRSKKVWPMLAVVLTLGTLAAMLVSTGVSSSARAQPTAIATQPGPGVAPGPAVPAASVAPDMHMTHGAWRPESIWEFWAVVIAWGVIVIILLVLGYKVFDWLTPKIDFSDKLNQGNIAVAIVIAAFLLATAIVVHAVVSIQ